MTAGDGPSFEACRGRSLELIEAGLAEALAGRPGAGPDAFSALGALNQAMGYTLLGGGKRLRALLALAAAEAAGGRDLDGMPAALAAEMVHAYSLIHDDLPALDDDDTRRGRPANHVAHGEAMAILAGDALQSLAFETLAAKAPPGREGLALKASLVLAEAIGPRGMAGGQALDLALEGRVPGLETVILMESLKTGRLISAALAMGAILGGGSEAAVAMAAEAGLLAGLAFQIKDDLLNSSGDPALMGKRVGTDSARGKASAAAAIGEAAAEELAESKAKTAAAAIAPLGSPKLERLFGLMVRRDR